MYPLETRVGPGCMGVGSGQTRGPGRERNFPSFSSRPLWLGSSREGEMSQRAAEQGGGLGGGGDAGVPQGQGVYWDHVGL